MKLHRHGGIATKDVYLISYLPHRQCQAFSTADGRLLWEKMKGPTDQQDPDKTDLASNTLMFNSPLVIDSKIIARKTDSVFNILTGNPVLPKSHFGYDGCGRFTASASGLLLGQCGEVYSLPEDKQILHYNVKAACGYGQIIADGLLIKGQDNGDCDIEWRGPVTSRSRAPAPNRPAGARLEAGQAAAPGRAPVCDACDWPTYRGDATRKNSSPALIPAHAKLLWTFDPGDTPNEVIVKTGGYLPDGNSGPAAAVGNRIWFGLADGAIVCLDRATGAEQWRYWTAGRVMAAPTWWQGRLYAGSCDGWVYRLDAARGALLWRYRVAPEERRVMIGERSQRMAPHGQRPGAGWRGLCRRRSAWTIGRRGTLRLGCGHRQTAVGETLRWGDDGPLRGGTLAFGQGRLWWRTGRANILAIDPATGESTPQFEKGTVPNERMMWHFTGMSEGPDIGLLPGGWMAFGGRMFNTPADDPGLRSGGMCMFFGKPTPTGAGAAQSGTAASEFLLLPELQSDYLIPVWDDKAVLLSGRYRGGKEAVTPALIPFSHRSPLSCRLPCKDS